MIVCCLETDTFKSHRDIKGHCHMTNPPSPHLDGTAGNGFGCIVDEMLPGRITESPPSEVNTMLGIRTNPAIRKKEKKLSNTRNRSSTKKDWTPPPKFPVGWIVFQ